jgi:hypothetical protein
VQAVETEALGALLGVATPSKKLNPSCHEKKNTVASKKADSKKAVRILSR